MENIYIYYLNYYLISKLTSFKMKKKIFFALSTFSCLTYLIYLHLIDNYLVKLQLKAYKTGIFLNVVINDILNFEKKVNFRYA